MPDLLWSPFRGPRPIEIPPGMIEWRGYRLPRGPRFRWTELVAISAANGHHLTRDMLHRWRVWRYLPGPTPGGPTGRGRGKGETWSREAGVVVAWLARWQTDGLTYDVLRLALWPYRPEFARARPRDTQGSLVAFLRQDRSFHGRMQQAYGESWPAGLEQYLDVVEPFAGTPTPAAELLRSAGMHERDPRSAQNEALLAYLNHDALRAWLSDVPRDELATFADALRDQLGGNARVRWIFWNHPLGLARIVVRELLRARLVQANLLPSIDNST